MLTKMRTITRSSVLNNGNKTMNLVHGLPKNGSIRFYCDKPTMLYSSFFLKQINCR